MARNRRRFLKSTAGLAAGIAAGGYFSSTPARAQRRQDSLGFALVGLGSLSTNQLGPALAKTKHAHLAGIVTGTPEKEERWAQQYNIDRRHIYNYENFDKIADDDAIDVIYIVLPNGMHAEYTIRAAKTGRHVFCEKPMANSSEDCRRMIEACRQADRKLGIGYRCQFEPHHRQCIEFARKQTFGPLKLIEASFGFKIGDPDQWRLDRELAGGGPLMDVGIYALQACRYLTGREPVSVTATESKTDPEKFDEVEETLVWTMEMPDEISCYCATTYAANGLNRFKAIAENGDFGLEPAYSYNGIQGHSSQGPIQFPETDQFATEIDRFALSILEDKPFEAPGEEGLRDLLAIEAIYKAATSNERVKVQPA